MLFGWLVGSSDGQLISLRRREVSEDLHEKMSWKAANVAIEMSCKAANVAIETITVFYVRGLEF